MNLINRPSWFTQFCGRLQESFRWNNNRIGSEPMPSLVDLLEQAQAEWRFAKLYFNSVTEPDLIDHAIFYMDATEKKYVYLLKKARSAGISVEGCSFAET